MSNQSDNTAARPSHAYPDCPECGSNVLVDGEDYANDRYYCHACSHGFESPDGFIPSDHDRQRGWS